jgi:hypothetical protein
LGNLNITTVAAVPLKPANFISQTAIVTQGQTGVAYAINSVANANTYAWTFGGTGAAFSNTNTTNTSIDYDFMATSGNLNVVAINACGASSALTLAVTVNPLITLLDKTKHIDGVFYQNGYLTILTEKQAMYQYDIVDMNGISVLRGNQLHTQIDVSFLPNAIYVARVRLNDQNYTLKFVR